MWQTRAIFFFLLFVNFSCPANFLKEGFSKVGATCLPAVVSVSVLIQVNNQEELKRRMLYLFTAPKRDIFGAETINGPQKITTAGTGFLISQDGYIVTNHHVVDNALNIKVIMHDESILDADLIGFDASTDLAVIKVKSDKKLPYLKWSNSDKLSVGEWVVALGNPYGLGGTLTAGVISSSARDISDPRFGFEAAVNLGKVIQTDASINPGNSGGPLVNMQSETVGVNFMNLSTSGGSDGIGLAIPSNMAKKITQNIIKYGRIRRPWLGTIVQSITKEIAKNMGLSSDDGVIVVGVAENSPAFGAGIKHGDVVVTLDGQPTNHSSDFARMINEMTVGQKVVLGIYRAGQHLKLSCVLQEYQDPNSYKKTIQKTKIDFRDHFECLDFDFGVTSLTWQFRQRVLAEGLNLDGVMISDVLEGGWAEKHGLSVGDVILEVNRSPILSFEDFVKKYEAAASQEKPILLFLYKSGNRVFIALEKKPSSLSSS